MKSTSSEGNSAYYRATVIVNPASRSGLRVYRELLRSIGDYFHYDVRFTDRMGHATELAKDAREEVIIVCGGDGTINEIANGLAGRVDVAVTPTFGGYGCDLSRLFEIIKPVTERIREIFDKIRDGSQVKMSLSVVDMGKNSRFLVGVGYAGFGAEAAGRAHSRSRVIISASSDGKRENPRTAGSDASTSSISHGDGASLNNHRHLTASP